MTQFQNSKRSFTSLTQVDHIRNTNVFAKSRNIILENVLVIEYCNLKFVCNLVLEIWDFYRLIQQREVTKITDDFVSQNFSVMPRPILGYQAGW
jgi:hypothetical protein